MADNEDLRERMTENSGGGGTDKLQDPKVRAKLNKMWALHEGGGTGRNESVEAMKARNAAIRLAKGLIPRLPDGGVIKESGRKFKVQRFDDIDCIRFNLIYPADCKPGQPGVYCKKFVVSSVGVIQSVYEGFVEKSLAKAEAEFNEELDKGLTQGRPDGGEKPDVNSANGGQKAIQVNVNNSKTVKRALTTKPQKADRHKPGYMAEYMRQRRKNKVKP